MSMKLVSSAALIGLGLALFCCDDPQSRMKTHDDMLTLDSHLDTPLVLDREGFDITNRHDWMQDYAQVDLPRMKEGGLDGGFWVIYTAQGPLTEEGYAKALAHARQRSVVIDDMVTKLSDDFALALQADEADRKSVV